MSHDATGLFYLLNEWRRLPTLGKRKKEAERRVRLQASNLISKGCENSFTRKNIWLQSRNYDY